MQTNVIGRVRNTNLPKGHSLMPLFEAVINSIDAIEEKYAEPRDGRIDIYINRIPSLLSTEDTPLDQRYKDPISGFKIVDNGIGFTDKNYDSFNMADSLNKIDRGGKGVGRFIWLKAFKSVQIESKFQENGSKYKRKFTFSQRTPEGISNAIKEPIDDNQSIETIVTLDQYYSDYVPNCPKYASTIGQHIVEHCLSYFLLGKMPIIYLHDTDDYEIDLWDVYSSLVESQQSEDFIVHETPFTLIHFCLHDSGDIKNHICLCANGRVVKTEVLSTKYIKNLPAEISEEDGAFIYAGYLLSDFLDQNVNQNRTDFDLAKDDGLQFSTLTYQDIFAETIKLTATFLSPYTEKVRIQKFERFSKYVNENAPQYRYILKHHSDQLDQIPADVNDSKLDSQLYEISRDIEQKLREDGKELINSINPEDQKAEDEYFERFEKWLSEYNESGKANLAKHILHRKFILDMFADALGMQDNGKYAKEEIIHRLIFPVKCTSDDIRYDQHNLWVLDEKLAYHHYLASDVPFKKQDVLGSSSQLRPDLAIFYDNSIAVVDDETPYSSGIVIFEFKRPMRDNFKSEDNPIAQIYDYIAEIKKGEAKNKDQRQITISSNTPFYCYIICDMTSTLRRQAENYGLKSTPDNMGYIGFNQNNGSYVEIISFDKLLLDSKRRNRILFDMLNLPKT